MRFELSPRAAIDVDHIAEYYFRHSIDTGTRFYDAISITLEALTEFPHVGRVRLFDDPSLTNIRSWPVDGFPSILLLYRSERSSSG